MTSRCKENRRYLIALLVFWLIMVASRIGLLRLFPVGGTVGTTALFIVWILLVVTSFVTVLLLDDSLPKNFLRIALLIGVIYTVVTLFAYCTDEDYHFMRAFGITGGEFMPTFVDGQPGIHLPIGFKNATQREAWTLANFATSPDLTSPVRELIFFPRMRSADYLPLCYLPGAIGVGLGRLFGAPLVVDVLLGRLTNYLVYVFICWYAIKRTKTFQTVFFLTALIPTSLELAGTFTVDSTLIASCLLFASICVHYCFDEYAGKITRRDLIILFISAVVLLSGKYLGYFAILALIFFLPKQRVPNKRTAILLSLVAFVLVAGIQLWAMAKYQDSLNDTMRPGADFSGQVAFILGHPASFVKMLAIDFMPNLINRLHYFIETGSESLNFLAEPLALLPIAGALLSKDKPVMTGRQKTGWVVLCLLIFSVSVVLSITALYLSFTAVGATSVAGMQNRYVLPVVALVYTAIALIPVETRIQRWERSISFFAALALVNILSGRLIELMAS